MKQVSLAEYLNMSLKDQYELTKVDIKGILTIERKSEEDFIHELQKVIDKYIV